MPQDDDSPLPLAGDDDAALPVEEGAGASSQGSSKIQTFGTREVSTGTKQQFKRPVNLTGAGATRVRYFHSKVTLAAIDHMVQQINEWLDADEVEVKYVSQVIGVVEGKKPEPNIIIMVWY